jgi:hypothetical protein
MNIESRIFITAEVFGNYPKFMNIKGRILITVEVFGNYPKFMNIESRILITAEVSRNYPAFMNIEGRILITAEVSRNYPAFMNIEGDIHQNIVYVSILNHMNPFHNFDIYFNITLCGVPQNVIGLNILFHALICGLSIVFTFLFFSRKEIRFLMWPYCLCLLQCLTKCPLICFLEILENFRQKCDTNVMPLEVTPAPCAVTLCHQLQERGSKKK